MLVEIGDNGPGIPSEVLPHIFEPFFTTKESGKGTGLGLSTVYGIVKQSAGHISVYSEVGKGTTFRIYLPQFDEPAVSSPPEAPRPLLRGTETVLLVEDEDGLRELTRECLESRGFVVLEARDGKTALEVAEHHSAAIHLLLTDLVMPGMSGRDVAVQILLSRPDTKLLYMSGYTHDLVTRHGVLEAGTALIEKPFSIESLLSKVRDVLDDKAAVTENTSSLPN